MIKEKYYCDWCGKEMPKLFYFIGSHVVIFKRYHDAYEDSICEECYEAFKAFKAKRRQEAEETE